MSIVKIQALWCLENPAAWKEKCHVESGRKTWIFLSFFWQKNANSFVYLQPQMFHCLIWDRPFLTQKSDSWQFLQIFAKFLKDVNFGEFFVVKGELLCDRLFGPLFVLKYPWKMRKSVSVKKFEKFENERKMFKKICPKRVKTSLENRDCLRPRYRQIRDDFYADGK